MVGSAVITEMQQVRLHCSDFDPVIGHPTFVKHSPLLGRGPHARTFGPQPNLAVRIPTTMTHPCTAIVGQSWHGPCACLRLRSGRFPLQHFVDERFAQGLVGIQTEHKWLLGLTCCPVLLIRISCERAVKHPCTMGLSNGLGRIRRTRINDHDLLCHPCHRRQASRQVERFIFGNDNDAKHGLQVKSCSLVPTGESAAQLWIKRLVAPCGLTYF